MERSNGKRRLIEWALTHHKLIVLLIGVLVAFGIYSLIVMPKNEFPTFTIRQGVVVGAYPGATTKEVEDQLTKPLERFIWTFKEVNKTKTYSLTKDGFVYVFVTLNDNVYKKDEFWSKFKIALSQFKSQLPPGVLALIANDDFGDTSALLITLESRDKTYRELESYLDKLEDRLRKNKAIANFRRYGVQKEQIGVYVSQEKSAAYGISNNLLLANIFTQGTTILSGRIDNGSVKVPLHISETYKSERELSQQVVYADPAGNILRLQDIATVKREYPKPSSYIENNGKKCVLLSLEMNSGNNIVKFGKDVNKILDQFESELPEDVDIYRITDQSKVVSDSVNNFLKELLIAIVAVILVTMVLLPLRVASVAAATIPISIFVSLGIFYSIGIELNTVSLAALIVTLGMIVDNSVVIIDCYLEYIDEGMDRWKAAVKSATEFFMSIFSATLAISITFFPFILTLSGIFKDFVKIMPVAMTVILMFSFIVAVMLVPYMQLVLITKGRIKRKNRRSLLEIVQSGYDKFINLCFSHIGRTLAIGAVVIIAGVILFANLPQRLMPVAERNQFAVEFTLPEGTTIEQTSAVADSMRRILAKDERVKSITTFIGASSPRFHTTYAPSLGGSNFAQFIVNTNGNRETIELLDEYSLKYENYFPQAIVRFRQLDYTEATYPVEVRLSGDNRRLLAKYADSVKSLMQEDKRLRVIKTSLLETTPGVNIELNSDESIRLGVNKTLASLSLAMRFGDGLPVTTLWEGDYPMKVMLKEEKSDSLGFQDLSNTYINSLIPGNNVPLRQIADIKPDWNSGQIQRRGGIETVSITADVARNENVNKVTKIVERGLKDINFPSEIDVSMGGSIERDNEVLPEIILGLIVAIIVIFMILLFHFKKNSLATLVIGSMVFSLPGTALGLWVMDKDMSLTAILGVVSLLGIIARNGIIMIDYAEELRKSGMAPRQAAISAASRRMRPIFLTSAAASMGVIPMILGGNPLWSPMGAVVCFGTIVSMLLIITVLPILYYKIFQNAELITQPANSEEI